MTGVIDFIMYLLVILTLILLAYCEGRSKGREIGYKEGLNKKSDKR